MNAPDPTPSVPDAVPVLPLSYASSEQANRSVALRLVGAILIAASIDPLINLWRLSFAWSTSYFGRSYNTDPFFFVLVTVPTVLYVVQGGIALAALFALVRSARTNGVKRLRRRCRDFAAATGIALILNAVGAVLIGRNSFVARPAYNGRSNRDVFTDFVMQYDLAVLSVLLLVAANYALHHVGERLTDTP